jgi:Tfp pilus assembly protein PilO
MTPRNKWIATIAGGVLLACSFGYLIYDEYGKIDAARVEVAGIRSNIESSRKLIEGTGALEREVIVLRELSEVMKKILPDTDDVNNLVRTFQKFSEESGVRISGLKKRPNDPRDKGDFTKVAYTLSLDADAFQFLDFLDLTENHRRFMCVPTFHITAATRTQAENDKNAQPAHKIQVDVETYVYEPQKDAKPVKIDNYDRKRDLLKGEIDRRKSTLALSTYTYRGARGRRDPWIDPRVPVLGTGDSSLTVAQQMEIVEKLIERTKAVLGLWDLFKAADSPISELTTRAELETSLSQLDEDVRRVVDEKSIRYVPSERKLKIEVVDALGRLRKDLAKTEAEGPSANKLHEIEVAMSDHQQKGEYRLVLEAFQAVASQLALADKDPLRKPLVDRIREMASMAQTVLDFQKIDIKVGGVAVGDDGISSVLLNGKSVGVGDMLDKDLLVRTIRPDEIEFVFRGIIFARRF